MLPNLVLASSSPWRRQILDKLGLPYRTKHPDIDETPLPAEAPADLVARLALEKAQAVAATYSDALIIGSDQVAVLDDQIRAYTDFFNQPVPAQQRHRSASNQC